MFHQFVNAWGKEPGMTVKCVDCGMIMSAHEMMAHECPAPGEVRLLGEMEKEQTDASDSAPAAPQAERSGPAEDARENGSTR